MYEKFLNYFTDYIFVKDEPQKADVIFVPGNGYPQMAAHAAELWKEGFAPYVLPSGRYSTVLGHFAGVQDLAEQYGGNYETEWEFLRTVLQKNGVPEKRKASSGVEGYSCWNFRLSPWQFTRMHHRRQAICSGSR